MTRLPAWLAPLCTERLCHSCKRINIFAPTIIYGFPFKKIFPWIVLPELQLFFTPDWEGKLISHSRFEGRCGVDHVFLSTRYQTVVPKMLPTLGAHHPFRGPSQLNLRDSWYGPKFSINMSMSPRGDVEKN